MSSKEWFLAKDLAGIEGMPKSLSSVSRKASLENWEKRQVDGVKGVTFEYSIKSLPEKTRNFLQQGQTTNVPSLDEAPISIPYYEIYASAGSGLIPSEGEYSPHGINISPQLLLNFGVPPTELFAIAVKGDSMEPALFEGDIIMVKRIKPPMLVLEGVYVLRIGGELFIKRIQFNKFEAYLQVDSDNDFYRSFTIKGEDLNQVEIIGEAMLALGRIQRINPLRYRAKEQPVKQ